jgi:hypothetical protein
MFVLTEETDLMRVQQIADRGSVFTALRDFVIGKPEVSEISCDCGALPIVGPIFQPSGPLPDNG